MLATESPFPQYADVDGSPLDAGSIYYGVVNQNPETNPVTVYWDAAGTQPAAQPVRTVNGFPVNNGTPALVFCNSDYSVTVKNRRGVLIFYAANSAQFSLASSIAAINAASLSFLQAGVGAVARTLQDKGRDFVSVADFAVAGSGADESVQFQKALTQARKLIVPAGMIITCAGVLIPSNTHLLFERGAGLKTANGANGPALQNVNWQKSGWGASTYGLDSDITIEGLYLDGNQANQAHTGTGPYAGEYTSGIRLFGVTNLKLLGISIHQARTFGIWLCAISNLTVNDIRFDQLMTGTPDNQDGLHINGPAVNLDIRNVRGSTNDDMIALNADDGALGSNVTAGAITNAIIDGVYPVGCLNGVRLLSASSRMDQIVVKNIVGSTRDVAVNQSPFGLGAGNVGTLTIENIDVQCSNGYAGGNYYAVVTLDGAIDNVSVRNLKRNRAADNRPSVRITSSANIGVCSISGLSTFSTGVPPANEQNIIVNGHVDTLKISDVTWFRDAALTQAGAAVLLVDTLASTTALGVNNLLCHGWMVERCRDVISFTSGQLTYAQLDAINHYNGDAGYALLNLNASNPTSTIVVGHNCTETFGRKLVNVAALSALHQASAIDSGGASGASASLTGAQALTAATYNKLLLNVLLRDRIAGEYSPANENFTISQGPGVYAVSIMVDLTIPTNPTDITVALFKGGSFYRALPGTGRAISNTVVGGVVYVNAAQGDVFDIRVFVSAAATANNTASTVVSYERVK